MTDNTHTDNEELRSIFARHGVYDGKTSLYFQREVDDFVRDVAQYIQANRTPQAAVQGDLLGQGGLLDQAITICKKYHDAEPHSYLEAAEIVSLCQKHFSSPTAPTKSSGELEEILDVIGYTPNLDSRAFAKEAIESYVATQTTKLQAEARINECAKTNAWACTIPAKHALGESGQEAVYDYVDQRIAALEREHKIGEESNEQ